MFTQSRSCIERLSPQRPPAPDLYPQAMTGTTVRLAHASRQSAKPRPAMLRVLIIDDNKDAADTFALLVRIWGHECRRVYDGSEAVKISSAFRPDVVFLDLGMPKIDGFAVARQLRPQLLHTGAMLIAVTGYADREHRLLCEQAGFAQFLPKPVDPEIVGTLLLSEKNRRANAGQSRGYCTANYREQLP